MYMYVYLQCICPQRSDNKCLGGKKCRVHEGSLFDALQVPQH